MENQLLEVYTHVFFYTEHFVFTSSDHAEYNATTAVAKWLTEKTTNKRQRVGSVVAKFFVCFALH